MNALHNWRYYLQAGTLLMAGCMIYLLYRPKSILLFDIINKLGLMENVNTIRESSKLFTLPDIVIYCIPAGLWTASYLMMIYSNTKFLSRKYRLLISLPLPVSAIILEFFQLWGWCPGTFDIYDLICYVIPLIIFIKTI